VSVRTRGSAERGLRAPCASLRRHALRRLRVKPASDSTKSHGSVSGRRTKLMCSVHWKGRSQDCLEADGSGGWKCQANRKCCLGQGPIPPSTPPPKAAQSRVISFHGRFRDRLPRQIPTHVPYHPPPYSSSSLYSYSVALLCPHSSCAGISCFC